MPPVRWKIIRFSVTTMFLQVALITAAAQQMQHHQQQQQQQQDSISMSSDGWRPIVGIRRQQTEPEITHYANPNSEFDIRPAQILDHETTTHHHKAKNSGSVIKNSKPISIQKYSKGHQQYLSIPQLKKQVKKPITLQSKPRKPSRGQVASHSTRNEVFLPPPSNSGLGGGYTFLKPPLQNNVKIREAQGLAIFPQTSSHFELSRFPLAAESIQVPRPAYFLAKPGQDFGNLVPPPRSRGSQHQKNKSNTKISLYAFKDSSDPDTASSISQFGARPNQYLPQVVPTYQAKGPIQKDPAVEVQVTKENLKQFSQTVNPIAFGTIPPARNNFPIGYVDYNFSKNTRLPALPTSASTLTYEVTEGKWLDTPSQHYQFRPQDGYFQYQNIRQTQNARPGLFYQSEPTSRPNIFQAPLVDLNVPSFLPTPYKTEALAVPTSPTQNEAATVFAQVSGKIPVSHQQSGLQENPMFFDIKDVSTHYPILGVPETATDVPEISNEITTTLKEVPRRPTQATIARDPTKARVSNRRRPRPSRPATTTSTTTTTEETVVEMYETLKNQDEEVVTERPLRRRRPRPPSYITNQDERIDDESPGKIPRVRYRPRIRPENENVVQRKRLRPSSSFEENLSIHEESEGSSQSIESPVTSSVQKYEQLPIQQNAKPFIEEVNLEDGSNLEEFQKITTTESEINTPLHIQNEIDFTINPHQALKNDLTTMTTSQATTSSTTPEPNTTKFTRIRRPTKYDTTNRPRFSVKEYRQRLSQHISTSTTTTPASTTRSSDNLRLRFPGRLRTRPSPTTASSRIDEDVTDESANGTTMRMRFKPKEARFETTTQAEIITEKSIKSVNTRLRPFGRNKSSTETTTAGTKVSIRPNLFSAKRRVGYPSLKSRIQNKLMKNEEDKAEESTTEVDVEGVEPLNAAAEHVTTEVATSTRLEKSTNSEMEEDEVKNQEFVQSQRVSDLTSSFKDYDKPGAFNSVAPTSRSIPNHFTISTDDPILPIEAFFPSLKDKAKER
ncbi:hypothetical protein ABEB36_002193 [Hypothenemus hampei]